MTKEKTIAATTILSCSTEEELDFLTEKANSMSGVQPLRQRQLASNCFELEVYCEDITDVFFLGKDLGRKFPNQKTYKSEDYE